jgi:flagellar secretion chaperone FliS
MKSAVDAKRSYRENVVCSATPIELIVILFDTAINDMRRAAAAANSGDREERAEAIRHAMRVLQQLQGTLDFEKGGQVARQFEQFYNLVRAKLLEASLHNASEPIQQQIQFMSEVRDCWAEAETQLHPKSVGAAKGSARASQAAIEEGGSTCQWSA